MTESAWERFALHQENQSKRRYSPASPRLLGNLFSTWWRNKAAILKMPWANLP
jgi:hypothetical protein